jgi:hypothetical protein
METFDLRHAAGVEVAADGSTRVTKPATRRRGLVVVGCRLLDERAAALRAGRPWPSHQLNLTELRAMKAASDERDGLA